MADISAAVQAKSDQLNAVDIMGIEPVITIKAVTVNQSDQPVSVFYHGDNNRPWKPSKGMLRILQAGWGSESDNWIGKSVKIFMNPKVKYAGKEVGGVQIRAMSDIDKRGITCAITINRQKREPFLVEHLDMTRPTYPQAQFEKALPAMTEKMQTGEMTLQAIIARCQQTGDLTEQQLQALQDSAPVLLDDSHD